MKKVQTAITFLITLFVICFFNSCKKDDINKSNALVILQNKWTPIAFRIYFPDGSNYKLVPPISQTFTLDGMIKIENYVTTNSGTIIEEKIIAAYKLLPDDSTLLFYPIINGIQHSNADTSFISVLTNNLLIYYSKENNFINSLDSLKR